MRLSIFSNHWPLADTANINGFHVCNVATVIRVRNASFPTRSCVVDPGVPVSHSVALNWTASASQNIAGYNIYRGNVSGGPYVKINTSLIAPTTYTDNNVEAGRTYYYVGTAVNTSSAESIYSNQAPATIPTP